jgi:hypothetical protein
MRRLWSGCREAERAQWERERSAAKAEAGAVAANLSQVEQERDAALEELKSLRKAKADWSVRPHPTAVLPASVAVILLACRSTSVIKYLCKYLIGTASNARCAS